MNEQKIKDEEAFEKFRLNYPLASARTWCSGVTYARKESQERIANLEKLVQAYKEASIRNDLNSRL